MLELMSCKMCTCLLFLCRDYSYKYKNLFDPMEMADSMVLFLLKNPQLLQEPMYKQLYDALLEFQVDTNFLELYIWDKKLVKDLDRDDMRKVMEMINYTCVEDESPEGYKIDISYILDLAELFFA